ncbi:hypothetical protein Syun_014145 [Stephania yunnanensis]|uniref:Uncharacterized protein n=1 Tax=Stephania yunnanensis TaxID=152371 RepID=A0AAP0PBI7_9MAGN
MEYYLMETSDECEVFQIEPEIVIALNEGEDEMNIDVNSDKPEKPQIESEEDQLLVLVQPPTLPCPFGKPYKGVEVREHLQIFYTADTFVLDDPDTIDSFVLEVPDELLNLKEGMHVMEGSSVKLCSQSKHATSARKYLRTNQTLPRGNFKPTTRQHASATNEDTPRQQNTIPAANERPPRHPAQPRHTPLYFSTFQVPSIGLEIETTQTPSFSREFFLHSSVSTWRVPIGQTRPIDVVRPITRRHVVMCQQHTTECASSSANGAATSQRGDRRPNPVLTRQPNAEIQQITL